MDEHCRQILADLEVYLDGECTQHVAEVITRHMDGCEPCLHRADFEREIRAIVARSCHDDAPLGLVDRVFACVRGSTTAR